jgi:hypothetical protein
LNELKELHIKGELAGKGFLKESYDYEIDDLKHELTESGREEIRKLFKDIEWRKEFLKMAVEEAKKYPDQAKLILKEALTKMKEYI